MKLFLLASIRDEFISHSMSLWERTLSDLGIFFYLRRKSSVIISSKLTENWFR